MRTKESSIQLKELHDLLLDVIRSYPITTVFAGGVNDLTTVVYETEPSRTRFYLFSRSANPVAELSNNGEYLILHPFKAIGLSGDQYITEPQIVKEVHAAIGAAKFRRDQVCTLETRMTYEELTGDLPIAATGKKR